MDVANGVNVVRCVDLDDGWAFFPIARRVRLSEQRRSRKIDSRAK
jgi:hypothetical protein